MLISYITFRGQLKKAATKRLEKQKISSNGFGWSLNFPKGGLGCIPKNFANVHTYINNKKG